MNSITSGLSGLALRRDGVKSNVHSGSTLESYVLPANLRIDDNETNLALSCMEVIKVSKVSIHIVLRSVSTNISYAHILFSLSTLQNPYIRMASNKHVVWEYHPTIVPY